MTTTVSPARRYLDKVLEVQARGLCKHALALDASGRSCDTHSPDAVAFCLHGACLRAEFELRATDPQAQRAFQRGYNALYTTLDDLYRRDDHGRSWSAQVAAFDTDADPPEDTGPDLMGEFADWPAHTLDDVLRVVRLARAATEEPPRPA